MDELGAMEFMLENSEKSYMTHQLSDELKHDLSTIQRSVKKLHESEIIVRSQSNLKGGGYVFLYQISPKKKIREIIREIVFKWAKKVESELDKW